MSCRELLKMDTTAAREMRVALLLEDLEDGIPNLIVSGERLTIIDDTESRKLLASPETSSTTRFVFCSPLTLEFLTNALQGDPYFTSFVADEGKEIPFPLTTLRSLLRIAKIVKPLVQIARPETKALFIKMLQDPIALQHMEEIETALANAVQKKIRYDEDGSPISRSVTLKDILWQVVTLTAVIDFETALQQKIPLEYWDHLPPLVQEVLSFRAQLGDGSILAFEQHDLPDVGLAQNRTAQNLIAYGKKAKTLLEQGNLFALRHVALHELSHRGQDSLRSQRAIARDEGEAIFVASLYLVAKVGKTEAQKHTIIKRDLFADAKNETWYRNFEYLVGRETIEDLQQRLRAWNFGDEALTQAKYVLEEVAKGETPLVDIDRIAELYSERSALVSVLKACRNPQLHDVITRNRQSKSEKIDWTALSSEHDLEGRKRSAHLPHELPELHQEITQHRTFLATAARGLQSGEIKATLQFKKAYDTIRDQTFDLFIFEAARDPRFSKTQYIQDVIIPLYAWEERYVPLPLPEAIPEQRIASSFYP